MRNLRRFGWAAVLAAVAGPAFGQQPGGGGVPGGGATVSPAGSVTTSNGNVLGGSFGANAQTTGGSGSSTGGNGGPTTEGTALPQFEQAPQLLPPSSTQTGTATGVDASNFLGRTYAAPYFGGKAGTVIGAAPGGFGTALYQVSGGAAGGRAGATTAGRAGLGGGRGSGLTNPTQIVIQPAAALAAPAQLKFSVPPPAAPALQADLRGVLNGVSPSMLANPAGVQVQVADGNTVVLRGAVRDEDEARLVVGLARLTPGVRDIRSELTFPRP